MTSCPAPEIVQAAAAGVLPPALSARVTEHLVDCAICRALVDALEDPSVGDLGGEERERIWQRVRPDRAAVPPSPAPRIWRWLAPAAVLTVAVAIGTWWLNTAVPPASEEPWTLVPDPAPLAAALSGERPDTGVPVDEWTALTLALAPYRQGDLARTARNLADAVERYPQSARGYFYLGLSNLLLGRDRFAVRALEQAERLAGSGSAPLAREVAWFLAVAYWRTGQLDHARLRLTRLCDTPGEFADRACTASQSLGVVTLSGTVTTLDGSPLAGVTVAHYLVWPDGDRMVVAPTSFASASDGNGRYTVIGVPEVRGNSLVLRARKPGYFTASRGTPLEPEMRADFQLRPWTFVSLDDVVYGPLDPADDECGDETEPCRQVAIVAPTSGILDVFLTTPVPWQMDVWVETPDGDVSSPPSDAPLRVSVPVEAGEVYQVTVKSWVPRSPPFELRMQAR